MGIGDKSIYCPVYGTVIRAGWECATLPKKGFGQRVVVRIGSTAYYMYFGHLSKINVAVGQKLKPGDLIGVEGSTGHSTGSHLHWEIRMQQVIGLMRAQEQTTDRSLKKNRQNSVEL